MCFKLGHAKFQLSTTREHFQMSELKEGGRKNVCFLTENWPYLGNGERYDQGYY